MNRAPYSLQEAEKISTEFQYLNGRSFAEGMNAPIQCIAITPFDHNSKNRFIAFYFLLNDAAEALKLEHHGNQYDVMVLACSEDQTLLYEDLSVWLANNDKFKRRNTEISAIFNAQNKNIHT
jgi:hypothetical protein